MCFFFSFMPATALVVIGYFVLFSSTKTEGVVRKIGKILAIWLFVIAAFFPIMGAYMTIAGLCPMEGMMQTIHGGVSP